MTRAKFTIADPGAIPATLEMTMTIEQWAEVRKALTTANFYGPTGWLRDAIDTVTRKAEREFNFDAEAQTGELAS